MFEYVKLLAVYDTICLVTKCGYQYDFNDTFYRNFTKHLFIGIYNFAVLRLQFSRQRVPLTV